MTLIDSFSGANRYLSNFWLCPVIYDHHLYRSSEHAFQAAKFNDPELKERIRSQRTPKEAKQLAWELREHKRSDWKEVSIDIMTEIVRIKFRMNPELASKLISTGNATLIEGNYWHDDFWGVCTCPEHKGTGENNLGKILGQIRGELQTNLRMPPN